jgi:hypothetical protein
MSSIDSNGEDLLDSNRLLFSGIQRTNILLKNMHAQLNLLINGLAGLRNVFFTLAEHIDNSVGMLDVIDRNIHSWMEAFEKWGKGMDQLISIQQNGEDSGLTAMLEEEFIPGTKAVFSKLRASTTNYFAELDKALKNSTGGLFKLARKFGTRKIKQGIKQFGGALGQMAQASVQAWAMQQLMKLIEPFMMLLKPFEPLFTVLGGILKKSLAPAVVSLTKGMMTLIKPLIDVIGLIWGNSPGIIPGFRLMWDIGKKVVNAVLYPFQLWFGALKLLWDTAVKPMTQGFEGFFNTIGMLWDNSIKGIFLAFEGFFDVIGTLWDNSVKKIFKGIEDFLNWVSGLNPANWFSGGGGGGGGGSDDEEFNLFDATTWFGPDMYAFNSPQMIGVGDESQTEYLMREDKLKALVQGTSNQELTRNSRDQVYLLERVARNTTTRQRWQLP